VEPVFGPNALAANTDGTFWPGCDIYRRRSSAFPFVDVAMEHGRQSLAVKLRPREQQYESLSPARFFNSLAENGPFFFLISVVLPSCGGIVRNLQTGGAVGMIAGRRSRDSRLL
jgi:hypothetical protein